MNFTPENETIPEAIADPQRTLLVVVSEDVERMRSVIEETAIHRGLAYFHWHAQGGVTRNTGQKRASSSVVDPTHFLLQIDEVILDSVYLMEDLSLNERVLTDLLVEIAHQLDNTPSVMVLLFRKPTDIPEALHRFVSYYEPDRGRSAALAEAIPLRQRYLGQRVLTMALPEKERTRLQESLDGGNARPDRVYRAKCSGNNTWEALSGALAPHATAVQDASFLEYYSRKKQPPSLPGFHRYRQAIDRLPKETKGAPTWFIDGLPGCGRALAPFVAADTLGCGVLRLNGAELVAQRAVHDLEAIHLAVQRLARSLAPVVLWLDHLQDPRWGELDPGLWLQLANDSQCLVIGTSREIPAMHTSAWSTAFDRRWWVSLPEPELRRAMVRYHLEIRNLSMDEQELDALESGSRHLSGGAIEEGILRAIRQCLDEEQRLNSEMVLYHWQRAHRFDGVAQAPPGWQAVHENTREMQCIPLNLLA